MGFITVVWVSGTLIVSGIVDKVLVHKGKEPLAETLRLLTHMGAIGYGAYFVYNLLIQSSRFFL